MIRILHTADWHLGKKILSENTAEISSKMLEWILSLCRSRQIDCVAVTGDIFDSSVPTDDAKAIFYSFLTGLRETGCRHIVLMPGNHDSAAPDSIPSEILSSLGVIVPGDDPESEAVVLRAPDGTPELALAAVPFIPSKRLPGERSAERWKRYAETLSQRYARVKALLSYEVADGRVPMVALGHFFADGALGSGGEALPPGAYVGSLCSVPVSVTGEGWDYVGLGHMHYPFAFSETVRYCGAPCQMSFNESENPTEVVLVSIEERGGPVTAEALPVPLFQPLVRVSGDVDGIRAKLLRVSREKPGAWIEVCYTGVTAQPDLTGILGALCSEHGLKLISVRNDAQFRRVLDATSSSSSAQKLDPEEVFRRFLVERHEEDRSAKRLTDTFAEALRIAEDGE